MLLTRWGIEKPASHLFERVFVVMRASRPLHKIDPLIVVKRGSSPGDKTLPLV